MADVDGRIVSGDVLIMLGHRDVRHHVVGVVVLGVVQQIRHQ